MFLRQMRSLVMRLGKRNADIVGQVAAINRALAIIEFELDGTIIKANENFLTLMGYTLDEVKGKHHSIFVSADEKVSPEYIQLWKKLNRGELDQGVYHRLGKGGSEFWINATYNPILDRGGHPFKIVKYARDVTQEQIQAADYAGQIAAINRARAVIEFDTKGYILTANENFLKAVGYSLADIVGKHHSMFVDGPERSSAQYRGFWQRLGEGNYDGGLYRRIRKDGRELWLQANYNPIFDVYGRVSKVVKYATDVTVQTQATDTLQAAVGGLTEALKVGADSALEANALVQSTSTVAKQGGEVMNEVVAKMATINSSAEKITDIVSVIDEITFRTNLLALNAAVEAARAGEHGRGFGVVASEVRSLAQRTAASASEIKILIGGSVKETRQGADLVRNAGKTIEQMVTSIDGIATIIGTISTSANNQTNEIKHVSETIRQLQTLRK